MLSENMSQCDIYCRKCGNDNWDSFLLVRSSQHLGGTLSFTEKMMIIMGSMKIVRCGCCGHDMLFTSNDIFVRNIED